MSLSNRAFTGALTSAASPVACCQVDSPLDGAGVGVGVADALAAGDPLGVGVGVGVGVAEMDLLGACSSTWFIDWFMPPGAAAIAALSIV